MNFLNRWTIRSIIYPQDGRGRVLKSHLGDDGRNVASNGRDQQQHFEKLDGNCKEFLGRQGDSLYQPKSCTYSCYSP